MSPSSHGLDAVDSVPDGCLDVSRVPVARGSGGIALEGRLGQAYNEEAFRYFLEIERRRAERSGWSFLLLLVQFKEQPGRSAHIEPTLARRLFSGLCGCLRETDVVGWYRQQHVMGAVLVEFRDEVWTEVAARIRQRVSGALGQRLSAQTAGKLQVRVCQPHASEQSNAGRPYSMDLG